MVRVTPTGYEFAAEFNCAVVFIDRHLAEGRGGKTALISSDSKSITYADLAEQVGRCGNALLALGVMSGDRIVLILEDSPAFFYTFWGAIKAGIVPVPVNTLLRTADFRYIIEDSGCRVVIYSSRFAGEVEPAMKGLNVIGLKSTNNADSLEARMHAAPGALAPAMRGPLDDCFWLYSSGSTGRPKGAVHRQRDLVVTSQRCGIETLGLREDDVCFSAAKLFFAYGLGNALSFPLWVGGTAVLDARRPTPESTFETIARHRPSLYFGVPTLYAAQLKAMEAARPDLSSLRLCVSAGEALPTDIFERWRAATGLTILDGIGSTEALHMFISNRADDVCPGASGRLVPGYEARVVDERGQELPPGERGHLHIRGDSIARCYWNQPQKTAAVMEADGWLRTGDVYFQDGEGYFHYCGRDDDMLKIGGMWCSPIEIESCLIAHPAVLEAAVVGRIDEEGLIKPAAYIVLNNRGDAGEPMHEELKAHCQARLARYKYPRWFEFLDELPKTATGKIQRFMLRGCAPPDSSYS